MSTSDLRAGGLISGPTGFVHVSGYGRNHLPERCSSVTPAALNSTVNNSNSNNSANNHEVPQPLKDQNNRTSRARELSNIDPKFTSQVSSAAQFSNIIVHQGNNIVRVTILGYL